MKELSSDEIAIIRGSLLRTASDTGNLFSGRAKKLYDEIGNTGSSNYKRMWIEE